jgi:hypothetical protein
MANSSFGWRSNNGMHFADIWRGENEIPVVVTVHIKGHINSFWSAVLLGMIWPTWISEAI